MASMDQTEIPVSVVTSDEPMNFEWRITAHPEGRLGVDVGDLFEPKGVFGEEQGAVIAEIGFTVIAKGLNLMGFGAQERQVIASLILQMRG